MFIFSLHVHFVVYFGDLGTFLVNGMSVHVLFDSGATRSFVSLALSKKFRDTSGTLDSPLEVEIADDRTVSAERVYRGCVLNMHNDISGTTLMKIVSSPRC